MLPGLAVIGPLLENLLEFSHRRLPAAPGRLYAREVEARVGVVRVDCERSLELLRCLLQPGGGEQRYAQFGGSDHTPGIRFESCLEMWNGVRDVALAEQQI